MGLSILVYCGLAVLLSFLYGFLIYYFIRGWNKQQQWPLLDHPFQTSVSIIVPARNEEENILSCLGAILAQKYPPHLLEVIVVDDHSTDRTAQLVEEHPSAIPKLIRLAEFVDGKSLKAYKKKALEIAVLQAKGDLIVTTDADCVMGEYWIATLVTGYEIRRPKIMAAPVLFHNEKSVFEQFQSLDFLGLMGVTAAGIQTQTIHLANGANLAFEKTAFEDIGGYRDIDKMASGDDIMLMQKMVKAFPGKAVFVNDPQAATFTHPEPTLNAFVNQRIRWATKTNSYQDIKVTLTWALVWLYCLVILIGLFLTFAIGWPAFFVFMFSLLSKSWFDYQFLKRPALFFQRPELLKPQIFLLSVILELLYVLVIGLLGLVVRNYEWKGRKVK